MRWILVYLISCQRVRKSREREARSLCYPIYNTWRHWWRKEPFLSGAVFQWRDSSASFLNTKTDISDEPQKHTVLPSVMQLSSHNTWWPCGFGRSWQLGSYSLPSSTYSSCCKGASAGPCFSDWSGPTARCSSHSLLYVQGVYCCASHLRWWWH